MTPLYTTYRQRNFSMLSTVAQDELACRMSNRQVHLEPMLFELKKFLPLVQYFFEDVLQ